MLKVTVKQLRRLLETLDEVDVRDVKNLKRTEGSTHLMQTGTIDGVHHYIKFSDEGLFDDVNPSLQPLVEFLAYNVYSLYPDVRIPQHIDLVFDKENERVGIATSAIKGRPALVALDPKTLGKKMSAGVYVDIFLANWDVVGTETGNVIIDDDAQEIYRIDPGGSLTFRAQGGKKGSKFSPKAGELNTMLDPDFGSGQHFQFADLERSAENFMSVSWQQVSKRLRDINDYVTAELVKHDIEDLLEEWNVEFDEIASKLSERWKIIAANAKQI